MTDQHQPMIRPGVWGGMFDAPPSGSAVCSSPSDGAVKFTVAVYNKSAPRIFRYVWARCWDPSCEPLVWMMVNPSTATEQSPDKTVTACLEFTKQATEDAGGLIIVNLFAYRAREWREIRRVSDPVGGDNDEWIGRILESERISGVVVAWGNPGGEFPERRDKIKDLLRKVNVPLLQLGDSTKKGEPRHPSRLSYDTPIHPYESAG